MQDERQHTIDEFHEAVNMTAAQLRDWLSTKHSAEVGWVHEGEQESIGHQSGKRIVALLGKKKADCDEDDVAHMKKVIAYVHRHLAQRPTGDLSGTRWRYSLMNWGHDPVGKGRE